MVEFDKHSSLLDLLIDLHFADRVSRIGLRKYWFAKAFRVSVCKTDSIQRVSIPRSRDSTQRFNATRTYRSDGVHHGGGGRLVSFVEVCFVHDRLV